MPVAVAVDNGHAARVLEHESDFLLVRDCGETPEEQGEEINGGHILTVSTSGTGRIQTVHAIRDAVGEVTHFELRNSTLVYGEQSLHLSANFVGLIGLRFKAFDPEGLLVKAIVLTSDDLLCPSIPAPAEPAAE